MDFSTSLKYTEPLIIFRTLKIRKRKETQYDTYTNIFPYIYIYFQESISSILFCWLSICVFDLHRLSDAEWDVKLYSILWHWRSSYASFWLLPIRTAFNIFIQTFLVYESPKHDRLPVTYSAGFVLLTTYVWHMSIVCEYPYPHMLDSKHVTTQKRELMRPSLPRRSFEKDTRSSRYYRVRECAFDVVCFSSWKSVVQMFRQVQKYILVKHF